MPNSHLRISVLAFGLGVALSIFLLPETPDVSLVLLLMTV